MTTATLLIVEDDGILAANLESIIRELGYSVLGPVPSGEEAIDLLDKHAADLVLMDIELAGALNGIETAERIGRSWDIPIVFLTGFSHDPLLDQAKIVAPYGYLVKPISERELAATVTMSLHRHAIDRELRESRKALAASEARYRYLFEKSPLGIFRISLEGRILLANLELAKMLGCASTEEAVATFTDLKHQLFADPGIHQRFLDLLHRQGEVKLFNCQWQKKDGPLIWISMNARLSAAGADETGDLAVIDGFALDITERKRVEEELQESEEKYRLLHESAGLGIGYYTPDGIVISYNEIASRHMNGRPEDFKGKSIHDLFPKEAALVYMDRIKTAINSEAPQVYEDRVELPTMIVWYLSTFTRIVDSSGLLLGVQIISNDISERKRTEEALRASEQRFRSYFDLPLVGIAITSLDKGWIEVNQKLSNILGYSREELVTLTWTELTHPDDLAMDVANFEDVLAGKTEGYSMDKRFICKDGKVVYAALSVSCVRRIDGTPDYFVALVQNITQRKQAEEAVIQANKLLQTIINTTPVRIFYKDRNLRYMGCNIAFAKDAGVSSPEDLIGKNDYQLSWKDQAELYRTDDLRVLASGTPNLSYDEPQTTPEGELIWLRTSKVPLLNASNQIIGVLGMYEDISTRKQAELELRASEQQHRLLVQNLHAGVVVHAPDTQIILANEQACKLLGLSLEQMTGKTAIDPAWRFVRVDETVVPFEEYPVNQVLASRQSVRDLVMGVDRPDRGDRVWILVNAFPELDTKGLLRQAVVTFVDITELKQTEEEREKLQAQLQQAQKLEAIGTLAGGIAHDFNNILGAIVGYAEMVRDDFPPGSPSLHDINQVLKASHRAKDLVKQILALSRQVEDQKIPMLPAVIVKEAITLLRSSLPTTIAIKQDIDAEAGMVLADPTQIHQIVMNLATNAFHAMEVKGGILTISLQKRFLSQNDPTTEPELQPGKFVQLSIKDTGEGIRPEIRERIFDPFFTTKEVGKGTGLGLSMVYSIVKSCHGSIACNSRLGEGAEFCILLPALEGQAQAEKEAAEPTPHGKEHILLIDDEEMLAELGQAMLKRLGYHVTTRRNSLDALTTFQNQPDAFDLIITDQTMPGMTGVDLGRRILQIRPKMPIILCTGYSSQISEEKAKAAGISGFAYKPLAKKDIGELIRKVLDGKNY